MSRVDIAELRRLHEAATDPHDGLPGDSVALRNFYFASYRMFPALLDELEAAREALSQIYWKSIDLGEDRGDSTINHIAADALRGDTSPLHARDRRMKLLGAAGELERLASEDYNDDPAAIKYMRQRAAQLRREAEYANRNLTVG